MGEDGIAEAPGGAAREVEGNLLAADGFPPLREVAVSGDPGPQARGGGAIDFYQDGAAGVIPGELADDCGIFDQGAGLFGENHEIYQRGIRARFIVFPKLAQLAIDGGDGNFDAQLGAYVGDGV